MTISRALHRSLICRYPELLKPPDTTESLCSDRNSSYDNVDKKIERQQSFESNEGLIDDPSDWEAMVQDSDIKRNKSFKERLDPLLGKSNRQIVAIFAIVQLLSANYSK